MAALGHLFPGYSGYRCFCYMLLTSVGGVREGSIVEGIPYKLLSIGVGPHKTELTQATNYGGAMRVVRYRLVT